MALKFTSRAFSRNAVSDNEAFMRSEALKLIETIPGVNPSFTEKGRKTSKTILRTNPFQAAESIELDNRIPSPFTFFRK